MACATRRPTRVAQHPAPVYVSRLNNPRENPCVAEALYRLWNTGYKVHDLIDATFPLPKHEFSAATTTYRTCARYSSASAPASRVPYSNAASRDPSTSSAPSSTSASSASCFGSATSKHPSLQETPGTSKKRPWAWYLRVVQHTHSVRRTHIGWVCEGGRKGNGGREGHARRSCTVCNIGRN